MKETPLSSRVSQETSGTDTRNVTCSLMQLHSCSLRRHAYMVYRLVQFGYKAQNLTESDYNAPQMFAIMTSLRVQWLPS